jgi:hypothetical protein
MIVRPSASEVDQYGVREEPPDEPRRRVEIPLVADDEAVCRVRVLETGVGAYWSQGDVDVHVLHARQNGLTEGFGAIQQPGLAQALRERREHRRRLQFGGVQTTASGLMLFQGQRRLVLPGGS